MLLYRTYPEGHDVHSVLLPLLQVMQGKVQETQDPPARYAPAKQAVQVVGELAVQYMHELEQGLQTPKLALLLLDLAN